MTLQEELELRIAAFHTALVTELVALWTPSEVDHDDTIATAHEVVANALLTYVDEM